MQDIDFGKFYVNKKANAHNRSKNTERVNTVGHLKKFSVFLLLFILAFTMGAFGGIYVSRDTEKIDGLEKHGLKKKEKGAEGSETQAQPKEVKEKLISKNVPPPNPRQEPSSVQGQSQADELKHKLKKADGEKTYLVWAKTYANRMIAYRHGHFLKKQDLPVFLAKSGDKMKLYVGPVYGKNQAYQTLAKVKKWAPFKGAILHEKNN